MLNIEQLTYFIDSLDTKLNERVERYNQNFIRRLNHLTTLDSTQAKKRITDYRPLNLETDSLAQDTTGLKWPFLDNFSKMEQKSMLDLAISATRTTRDNIVFNKDDFEKQAENIRRHYQAWHKKYSLSFACLILFFVGAPLGAIIRKGGLGLPVVVSILLFIVYHIASITGEKAARVGDLGMFTGMWLSSMLMLPIGLFLTFKATTDAPLLDAESWRKLINRMASLFKRKEKTA
jgi:lipopolysaccharide export system permease protein